MGNIQKNNQSKLVPGIGRTPFPAYQGKDPYIFVSYAHVDHEKVFPLIKDYHDRGYNVWYDEGIAPGNEWTAEIAKALKNCALFLIMITPDSVVSGNCKNEMNFAIAKKIPFIAIHLEPTVLPDDMELQIGTKQAILMYNMNKEEYVYKYTKAFERFGLKAGQESPLPGNEEKKPGQESGSPQASSNKILMVIAAVVAIAVIAGAGLMMTRKPSTDTGTGAIQSSESSADNDEADSGQSADSQDDSTVNDQDGGADTETAGSDDTDETSTSPGERIVSSSGDDYLYTQKYNGITLDKYAGKEANVIEVPDEIDGKPVAVIGEKCFEDHSEIEEVVLPDTVKIIRYSSFRGCSRLTKINIPASLESVFGWAFAHTSLKEMVFPDSLKKLEYGAFNTCIKLEKVVLPESIVYIDKDTFRGCTKLKSITLPSKDIDIDIKAFDEASKDLTIYGVKGSYAERYASVMGFGFEEYK